MLTLCRRTIDICLFFILAVIPLLVNPFTFNPVELIKRESAYALAGLVLACAIVLANKKKTPFACTVCP